MRPVHPHHARVLHHARHPTQLLLVDRVDDEPGREGYLLTMEKGRRVVVARARASGAPPARCDERRAPIRTRTWMDAGEFR